MTGACSGGRPRPCWHWLRCPRPGGRLRCTMTMRGRGGGKIRGGNQLWSRADSAGRRLRCRPLSGSEDPSHRTPALAPPGDRALSSVGAALAATRPLKPAGFDTSCCRGQKTPPTEPRLWLRRGIGHTPLWERPWPRRGLCCPPASMQAAVGVKTPPTEPRLRPPMGRDSCGSDLCGSGPGRDTAVAVRGLRFRLLSRASSLPRNRRQPCRTRSLRWAK